ncbi:MAG: hypothetical protein HGA65_09490, partial [Oscillochloris sp.]|nr:hypothetical protein [Oscillochloris sp.]
RLPPQPQRPEVPLLVADPALFREYVAQYGDVLDASVQERGFGVPDNGASARQLAARLGERHASARDIVDVHLTALRSCSVGAPPGRQQAYLEEGRMLALQIMGYLVTYYRDGTLT